MYLKYNTLKVIAIIFGIFTFIWLIYDFVSNKKDVNKNYLIANQEFLKKNYVKAYEYYELALDEKPGNIYFLDGKGRTLFRIGKYYEAEKAFKDAIEINEKFTAALANLGILYDTLGEYEKAIKYYKLAVANNSKITKGMSWFRRFLKNIHFKTSSVEDRLIFLQNHFNSKSTNLKLRNEELDKKQPDFEM